MSRDQTQLDAPDRGSGTVLMLGIVSVVAVMSLLAAAVGAVAVARGRAQSAADLGALAGAQAVIDGLGASAGCAQARAVVAANGAELATCQALPTGDVTTTVSVAVGHPGAFAVFGLGPLAATAQAHAAPPQNDTELP
jgi:secretion/DNA translocation related TadE-like protein